MQNSEPPLGWSVFLKWRLKRLFFGSWGFPLCSFQLAQDAVLNWCDFPTRTGCVFLLAELLLWSIIRQRCCSVELVMLLDTGTGCGSTTNLDLLSIRSVKDHFENTVSHSPNIWQIHPVTLVWMFHLNSPKEALYYMTSVCVSQELQELGGLKSIRAELPDWPVSDDTVLHLATAEGLITGEVIKTAGTIWSLPFGFVAHFSSNKERDWIG